MGDRALIFRLGAELSEMEKQLIKGAKAVRSFGNDLASLGKELTKTVSVPLTALGAAAVASSEDLDDAMDTIRAKTGKTGEALDSLGSTMRDVFSRVPADAHDVATAIAELSTRSNLTGDALSGMATQMLQLAKLTGTEVGPLIQSSTRAFASWGVETAKQGDALDSLLRVSQGTGVGVQQLTDSLTSSGAAMRAVGIDFNTGAALLGSFEKAGINGEAALAGISKAAREFASKGVDMADGFRSAVQAIQSARTPTEAAAVAVEKFGKSGVVMADAIRSGAFSVGTLISNLSKSGDTIAKAIRDTDGLAEAWKILKNNVTLALEPIGVAVTGVLIKLIDGATAAVQAVGVLTAAFGRLPDGVQTAAVSLGMVAAAAGPALVAIGAITAAWPRLVLAALAAKASVGPALAAMGIESTAAGAAVSTSLGGIAGVFGSITGATAAFVSGLGAAASALAANAIPIAAHIAALMLIAKNWDAIRLTVSNAASNISNDLAAQWTRLRDWSVTTWAGIKAGALADAATSVGIAQSMVSTVVSAFSGLSGPIWAAVTPMFSGVSKWFEMQWNSIITSASGWINTISDKIEGLAKWARGKVDEIKKLGHEAADAYNSVPDVGGGGTKSPTDYFMPPPEAAGPIEIMKGAGAGTTRSNWSPSTGVGGGGGGGVKDIIVTAGSGSSDQIMRGASTERPASGGAYSPSPQTRGYGPLTDVGQTGYGSLTRFAEGGIVSAPTRALIGEAGPEAVIPLSHLGGGMGGGGTTIINVYAEGSIASRGELSEQIRGDIIRTQQRNQTSGIV